MEKDLQISLYPYLTFHQKICRGYSYSVGHYHHRINSAAYSGAKMIETIWTLAGKGEVFWKEVKR
jgi:hypothetical protein